MHSLILHVFMLYLLNKANVLRDVDEEIGAQTNSFQSSCIEKASRKYTPDVFEKGTR